MFFRDSHKRHNIWWRIFGTAISAALKLVLCRDCKRFIKMVSVRTRQSTEPRAFVLRMRAPPMDDFAWGAKLTPPRVVSLGSDLSKEALIIKMYQVTCILVYLLKEHIHVTTSIEQHIHALFCVYVCYNEYWTTYTCVYTLKEHIHVFILLKNIYMCL
jgi:hypothetical protein